MVSGHWTASLMVMVCRVLATSSALTVEKLPIRKLRRVVHHVKRRCEACRLALIKSATSPAVYALVKRTVRAMRGSRGHSRIALIKIKVAS